MTAKERPALHLAPLADRIQADLLPGAARPPPVVTFYAYVATKSTIRERNGRLHIRLSDHLVDAPEVALEGLMAILVSRLAGKRAPPARYRHHVAAYEHHVHQEETAAKRTASRQRRGRKHLDPVGEHRSLLESYLRVTMAMGLRLPEPPRLSWSRTASRRRFGHHDPDHDVIVLSRVLDDPKVPEFVLDYVVYHELLHIVHPPEPGQGGTGRRRVHTPAFKEAEVRFPQAAEAERWLSRLASVRRTVR
ncbi:MAG: hypothetical protein ACPGQL_05180 [Thermoplasmatota archaeon]